MKGLITGAAGFTGRHLVPHLLKDGHKVVALDHPSSSLHNLCGSPEVMVVQHDLVAIDTTPLVDLLRTHQPDLVFHLAAVVDKDPGATVQERMFQVNVLGTLRLLEAIRIAKLAPMILVPGSSSQYGEVPAEEQPITETTPFRPMTLYAASKIAQERVALHFHQACGLPVICSRAFNLTGPGERPDFVCSAFARQIARAEAGYQEPVIRVGNLATERDLLDIRDAVHAYALLLRHGSPGEVYNVASGHPVPIRHVLDTLVALARVNVEVRQDPALVQTGDVTSQCGDWTKLRLATGWEPAFSLEQTLRDLLHDWRHRVTIEGQT